MRFANISDVGVSPTHRYNSLRPRARNYDEDLEAPGSLPLEPRPIHAIPGTLDIHEERILTTDSTGFNATAVAGGQGSDKTLPADAKEQSPACSAPVILQQNSSVGVGPARRSSNRSSAKERLVRAQHLDLTYGHACFYCDQACKFVYTVKGPKKCTLEQEHFDGNPNNNDLTNFRWGCRRCNLARRILAKHSSGLVSGSVSVRVPMGETGDGLSMVAYSEEKETKWRTILSDLLKREGEKPKSWLRGYMAAEAEIGVKTHDRYLEKNASDSPKAPFKMVRYDRKGAWYVDLKKGPKN